jgi:hypothetical protein
MKVMAARTTYQNQRNTNTCTNPHGTLVNLVRELKKLFMYCNQKNPKIPINSERPSSHYVKC